MWCNQYNTILLGGQVSFLSNYWDEYVSCPVADTTVRVVCWQNSTNVTLKCNPFFIDVDPEELDEDYCGNDYYSQLQCTGGNISGVPGPAGAAGVAGVKGATGAAGAGFEARSDFEQFVYDWIVWMFLAFIVIVFYVIWEKGPDSGFIQKNGGKK